MILSPSKPEHHRLGAFAELIDELTDLADSNERRALRFCGLMT